MYCMHFRVNMHARFLAFPVTFNQRRRLWACGFSGKLVLLHSKEFSGEGTAEASLVY